MKNSKHLESGLFRPRVFLAHGFNENPVSQFGLSEIDLATKLSRLLREEGFVVISGLDPKATPISEKITGLIDSADVVLGLFTCRLNIPGAGGIPGSSYASQFVLSECSYALGTNKGRMSHIIVGGLGEKGIDIPALSLVTIGGMEILQFERAQFNAPATQRRIKQYVRDIYSQLQMQRSDPKFTRHYQQLFVKKAVRVYRSGHATFTNTYKVLIPDLRSFEHHKASIRHYIYTVSPSPLPQWHEMIGTPISERRSHRFFAFRTSTVSQNGQPIFGKKLTPEPIHGNGQQADMRTFTIKLDDLRALPNKPITLEYQYAWGGPDLFKGRVNESDRYQDDRDAVSFAAMHGMIEQAEFEVGFERHAAEEPIDFLDPPQLEFSPSPNPHGDFDSAQTLLPEEESIWRVFYRWRQRKFSGSVKVSWKLREASSATVSVA